MKNMRMIEELGNKKHEDGWRVESEHKGEKKSVQMQVMPQAWL